MASRATHETGDEPAVDGRLRRSERSRRAIAEALFELVGEGVLKPTAQQVAERAGVGIRTVFRHFSDMETLFTELDARLRREILPLLREPPCAGSTAHRVCELMRRRAALFERIAPYKRASELQRWRSTVLKKKHRHYLRSLREDLLRWLPELATAEPELLEALDWALSFEAWNRLREDQKLGTQRALAVAQRTAAALMAEFDRGAVVATHPQRKGESDV